MIVATQKYSSCVVSKAKVPITKTSPYCLVVLVLPNMATWTSVLCYHLYLLKLISWFLPLIKNTVGCHIFPMKTFPVFSTLLMDWVGLERRYHNGRRLSDPRCHRINFSCSEAISIRMVIMIGFQEGCADTHFPFGAWKKVIFGRECILVGSR